VWKRSVVHRSFVTVDAELVQQINHLIGSFALASIALDLPRTRAVILAGLVMTSMEIAAESMSSFEI
jgi:hypothetical protein